MRYGVWLTKAALKKKYSKTGEETRYQGTLLGKPAEPRVVAVEGGDVTSVKEWTEKLRNARTHRSISANPSRPGSSDLSSLGDQDMEGMDF
jgi:transcription initiation factor TFIID subunit 3